MTLTDFPPSGGENKTKKGMQTMNSAKLMSAALCAAACVTTAAFAEDDFGIESATPVTIADPVNPVPGMVLRAYNLDKFMNAELLKGSVAKLPTLAAAKTMVDKGEEFSLKQIGKSEAKTGMWTGFLKCKRSGVYTFTLTQPSKAVRGTASGGYSFRVNGKSVVGAGWRETSVDVDLKLGWNKVDIVCQFGRAPALTIAYKPKDSLSEARPLTPAMMYYDKMPESGDDW